MKTITMIMRDKGFYPHPRIKNRFATDLRPGSVTRFTKRELVNFLRNESFDLT